MRRLGDLIDIRGGLSYKSKYIDSGDAKLLGMGCVSFSQRFLQGGCRSYAGDYTEKHLVEEGDLVIATRQQSENLPILGFPAMIPSGMNGTDIIVGTNLYKVNNQSNFANSFLFWLMRGEGYRSHVKACASGSTVRMITKDVILDYCFACPSEKEAEAIAAFLDRIEDKIELNQKMNQTLEEIAKAIFKSWFVDFDPVRAKAEGRPTGLPPEISDLFPDELVDSEIGEIPKGWNVGALSDVADITMGQSPPGDTYNDDGFGLPFYQGSTDFGFRFPSLRKYCSEPKRLADADDILISVRAPVGDLNRAKDDCCIGRGLASLRAKNSLQTWVFYRCKFLSQQLETFNSEGTVFGSINGKDLKGLPTILPPEVLCKAFDEIGKPMDDAVRNRTLEIEVLTELRETLLPKLISGELRIPDAEKFLEEAGI